MNLRELAGIPDCDDLCIKQTSSGQISLGHAVDLT